MSNCKFLFSALFTSTILFSNPLGQKIISGSCTFESKGNELQITASDRAIIHWKDFSIGKEETTRFIQPATSSIALNRVVSANISKLQGSLQANGRLILINPNGVVITKTGVVDTASFIASTLDIHDDAFLKNSLLKFTGSSNKGVLNYGTIKAWDGDVILISFSSENHGFIETENGDVHLIGSDCVYLKPSGSKHYYIQTNRENTSTIASTGNPYQAAINCPKEEDALEVLKKDGQSLLVASSIHTGKIRSYKKNTEESSQTTQVSLIGERVILDNKASIDVSSHKDAGSIFIGGSFQGKDPTMLNSEYTHVGPDAMLIANSKENGQGGNIILWSDGYTCFKGTADVRGGYLSGNGGLVEISGKKGFHFTGKTLRIAENGKHGKLLLDPNADVIIHHDNLYAGAFRDRVWIPTDSKSYIEIGNHFTAGTLLFELQQGDVTIQTEGKGFDDLGGNICIKDDLIYHLYPGHNLTLKTKGDILFDASLVNVGPGDVIIDSCNNLLLDATKADKEICLSAQNGLVYIKKVEKDLKLLGGSFYPAVLGTYKSVKDSSGSIQIDEIGRDLVLKGGNTPEGFALIGASESPSSSGSIHIDQIGNNLVLEADIGFCQIGHMQTSIKGALEGDISINCVGGNVELISSTHAKAHIGHGYEGKHFYSQNGNISLNFIGGNLNVISNGMPSQIGHATRSGINGDKIGDVLVNVSEDIHLISGKTEKGYSIIGHGGVGGEFSETLLKGSIFANAKGKIFVEGANIPLDGQTKNGFAVIGFALQDAKISSPVNVIAPSFQVAAAKDVIIRSGNASDAVIGAHLPLAPSAFSLDIKQLQLQADKYLFVEGFNKNTSGIYTEAVLGFRPDPAYFLDQYQKRLGLLIYGKNGIVVQGGILTKGENPAFEHPAFIRGLNRHGISIISSEGDLSIYAEDKGQAGIVHDGALQLISNEGSIEVLSTKEKDAYIEVYGNKLDMLAKEKINLKDSDLPSGKIHIKVDENKKSPTIFHSGTIFREKDTIAKPIESITIEQTSFDKGEDLQLITTTEDLVFIGTYFTESAPLFSLLCNTEPSINYYQDNTIQATYEANILTSEMLFCITPLMEYLGYKEQFSLCAKNDVHPCIRKNADFYIRRPYLLIKGLYQDPLYW